MIIAVIGLGLIGGSISLRIRKAWPSVKIIGSDINRENEKKALELGLADEITDFKTAVSAANLVILAVPVDVTLNLLSQTLNLVDNQVVMDVGSTKQLICEAVSTHPARSKFVASHPMWGTEYSGPAAATANSFVGKAAVICEKERSSVYALNMVENLYQSLEMHTVYMSPAEHDLHTAYISHVSHITSFALANTVLEKEKEDKNIFELASGGFESTVRLAKSHAGMWVPIFMQNRENVLDVLNEHIAQLKKFKSCLEKENYNYLEELIVHANTIKRVIK